MSPHSESTLNLYLMMLLNDELRLRLGVLERGFGKKVDARFIAPVRARLGEFKDFEAKEGGSVNMQMLEMTMERVAEVRESLRED